MDSFITQPNIYVRGILFGTMKYELGDHAYVKCPETGMVADVEFKTKGYFSGAYNAIGGYIRDKNGKNLYELSGSWNEDMYIKDLTVRHTPDISTEVSLTFARPARRSSSSMRQRHGTPHRKRDHSRSRTSANRSGYGTMLPRPSSARTRRQLQQQRRRSKTGRERRQRRGTTITSIGTPSSSEPLRVALADLMRAKKISIGSSTQRCQFLHFYSLLATNMFSDATTPEEQVRQILQIHAVLPGQKPEKQFSIPQRGESLSRQQTQEQPPAQPANGASLAQPEQQAVLAQQGAQSQTPVHQEAQQFAKQESQVQQVQQQLASVDLNQTTPHARPNSHEPISFSSYRPEGDSAYAPPPPQSQPAQGQTDNINPPSKLLHSNPAPEPTRDDKLRRKDSETHEEDEFHDAHS